MRRARKQLRGCKHLATGVLLYSEAIYRTVTPVTVASAAFGPGYQDARRYDRIEPWSPALRFPSRRECSSSPARLRNPFLSSTDNRSVSAVIVLERYRLSEFQLKVWKELFARQTRGQPVQPGASMTVAAELQHTVPQTYRFEGTIRVVGSRTCTLVSRFLAKFSVDPSISDGLGAMDGARPPGSEKRQTTVFNKACHSISFELEVAWEQWPDGVAREHGWHAVFPPTAPASSLVVTLRP